MPARRFFVWLGVITAAGLVIRLVYLFTTGWDTQPIGDAFNYHYTANGIAEGHGFQTWILQAWVQPGMGLDGNPIVGPAIAVEPTASYPPLYQLYLAAFSVVGLDSVNAHLVVTMLLGVASVAVIGLVGRAVAGPRVGLLSAFLAAVYANIWINDAFLRAETMTILLTAVVVLLAYRMWDEPSRGRVVAFAAVAGLSALVRSELALLVAIVMLVFVIRRLAGRSIKERIGWLALAGAVALLVVSPWLIRNLTKFENPILLTADTGVTLAYTSCDGAYYGPLLGWWDKTCTVQPEGDVSERNSKYLDRAFDYIDSHVGRVPVVMAARFGRMWGLYRPGTPWGELSPGTTLELDVVEGRPDLAARVGHGQYYVLMPFAIAGAVVLWRRRRPLAPLVVLPALASIAAITTFGTVRYRAIAEIAIVVLAAVAFDAILRRRRERRSETADDHTSESGAESESESGAQGSESPEPLPTGATPS